MNFNLNGLLGWFKWGRGALAEQTGVQQSTPVTTLVPGQPAISVDGALQISTVWACIDLRARVMASLPLFTYTNKGGNGRRELARDTRLYALLHDSPNSRMTPFEFWRALMMNHDLRGNAYARIDRDNKGEAVAMWPMPADQVQVNVLPNGDMVYVYRLGDDVAVLAEENVLHLKNLGNGTIGLSKMEFMKASINEASSSQSEATRWFGNGGKPTGILMVDHVIGEEQRAALKRNFKDLTEGSTSSLKVLEANMKYQAISLSPEQQQLLETRKYGVEELCRWYDTPPVLVHHANVTAWGSGIEQIVDGFHKLTISPMAVNIEQAVRKRVYTPAQRARHTSEFNLDAFLRGSAKDRVEIAAKKVQNGLATRNECRQLENEPPVSGGDLITVQSNLLPIGMLGRVRPSATGGADAASKDPEAQ